VAYALGGSVAQSDGGFRHGLDLAVMPLFFVTAPNSETKRTKSKNDYALGASGLVGFGDTPSYVALDIGFGDSSPNFPAGTYRGIGPVFRFPKGDHSSGFGGEVRLAFDILFVEVGLRSMVVWGRESSEWITACSLGLGRF
jgi:hypothetical protein